jgi:hypothetical protein
MPLRFSPVLPGPATRSTDDHGNMPGDFLSAISLNDPEGASTTNRGRAQRVQAAARITLSRVLPD